ncbi:hypothetical protein [Synechococcus sp. CBW1004]|nr:hypothetical protein [Synechococcus sp. CBW1004]QPN62320.1 hypothetical protein H8F25_11360 [Synechococcus sp. CBW1004]
MQQSTGPASRRNDLLLLPLGAEASPVDLDLVSSLRDVLPWALRCLMAMG